MACSWSIPDWDDDVDVDVRDTLGPMIAERVSAASGMPIRGNGLMSGRDRSWAGWIPSRHLPRYGPTSIQHDSPDRGYGSFIARRHGAMESPGVVRAMAGQTALAIADFYNVDGPIPISNNACSLLTFSTFSENRHGIGGGFRFWENRAGWRYSGSRSLTRWRKTVARFRYCERAAGIPPRKH